MTKQSISPWDWSKPLGFAQATLIQSPKTVLLCSGQTSIDAKGIPLHPNDIAKQIKQILHNIQTLLEKSGMHLCDVDRLGIFTTDMSTTLAQFQLITAPFASRFCAPAVTLVEVQALARPELLIEIEASASQC